MSAAALDARIRDPGYTPSTRDAKALVALLADDAHEPHAARALLRLGDTAVEALRGAFTTSVAPLRGRIVDVLADLSRDPSRVATLRPFLLACLDDDDAKTRRNAVIALGHHEDATVEHALLDLWRREPRGDHRRSIARALSRVGGDASLALLRAASNDDDATVAAACREAVLMLERRAARDAVSRVDGALPFPDDVVLIARCRPGFEALCGEEFDRAWRPKVAGPGAVLLRPKGRLHDVWRARTMLSFGFPLTVRAGGGDVALTVAEAITSKEALALFRAFTDGAVRFRLEWIGAGHRRGATRRCIEAVAQRSSVLVNDPRESTWEVGVREDVIGVHVTLTPKRLADPRFVYRKGDVPASSHPTLAATLARIGEARPDDVAWDPFAGSALELCERGLMGPYQRLYGSDLDRGALDVARENLHAAGLDRYELACRDARDPPPPGVNLVLTNPPLGGRVGFGEDVRALLDAVLANIARALPRGGRLVWVAPAPERALRRAKELGLTVVRRTPVALAGLDAEVQRLDKA